MSGRIEMYDNVKEPTSKWSRNESFAVKDAGVDIGADPEGGSGGTTDYSDLTNKPQINGVTLNGDKSLEDLGIDIEEVTVTPILETGVKIAEIQVGEEKEDIYAPEGGSGGGDITEPINAAVTVGGITEGTQYPAGTPIEDILSDMLSPTLYPEFTAPSASMTAPGDKLLEKGDFRNPVFTITLDRGSITPAYGTSGYRSGEATGYSIDGGSVFSGNTFTVRVDETKASHQGMAVYAAGEQPKDSKGNNYQSPLPAGSVNTNVITYEFVNALWANTASIGTIAKLALVSKSAKQKDMVFPAQTVANPEVFDVPASWTVTAVQVKNDLSGAYEDALAQFTVTDVTHDDAGGNSTAYKRYTFNMGFDTGARTVRLKWS